MNQTSLHEDFPEIVPKRLSRAELGYLIGIAYGLAGTIHRRNSEDCRTIGAQMKQLVSHIAYLEQMIAPEA